MKMVVKSCKDEIKKIPIFFLYLPWCHWGYCLKAAPVSKFVHMYYI